MPPSKPGGGQGAFSRVFCDIVSGIVERGARRSGQGSGSRVLQDKRVAVVIEDDADIRELVATVLEQAGFDVHTAGTGSEGVALVREHWPVVTTLDVSMPGIDGFETAKRIRAVSDTYIVMLTARTEEIDTLQGLQSGADDYFTKPFRPRELRARVEAMLRRPRRIRDEPVPPGDTNGHAPNGRPSSGGAPDQAAPTVAAPGPPGWLVHHGLALHPQMRLVTLSGEDVELTRSEFDILHALLEAGRRVKGKADLALMLRDEEYLGTTAYITEQDTRAIEVHVANLRRKLGESAARPTWIETVRGVGYRLTAR